MTLKKLLPNCQWDDFVDGHVVECCVIKAKATVAKGLSIKIKRLKVVGNKRLSVASLLKVKSRINNFDPYS